jgi:hypothetical protein
MNNTTSNDSSYGYNWENNFSTSDRILKYSVISIISFGIIGNLISLLIFTRPCLNSKTNTGKLYTLLCVINLIAFVYVMIVRDPESFYFYNVQWPFETEHFIEIILLQILSWIKVLITFDRFVSVIYPIKGFRIMSKKWVLFSIIFGMLIFILVVNSPYYIRVYTYTYGIETFTATVGLMTDEILITTETVNVLMQFFIPFLVMLSFDIKVIFRLRKSKNGAKQSANNSKSSRFTRNTLIIDFIYLFFNFPPTITYIYYVLTLIFNEIPMLAPVYFEILSPLFKNFPHIYSSLLFILFIISNSIFRSELILLSEKCFYLIKNWLF